MAMSQLENLKTITIPGMVKKFDQKIADGGIKQKHTVDKKMKKVEQSMKQDLTGILKTQAEVKAQVLKMKNEMK